MLGLLNDPHYTRRHILGEDDTVSDKKNKADNVFAIMAAKIINET